MNTARKPTHPGEIIRRDYMVPLKLSVTGLAAHLGIARNTLSQVANGRSKMTPSLSLRLSKAFNTSPELWLNLQQKLDLWEAERNSPGLENIEPLTE